MANKTLIKTSIILFIFAFSPMSVFSAKGADVWQKQRMLFKAAIDALDKDDFQYFYALQSQLKTYPLSPYVHFAYLRKTMESRKNSEFKAYIDRYKDMHLSKQMRTIWLQELVRREHWLTFVREYKYKQDEALRCQYAYALFLVGRQKQAAKLAKKLWLVGRSRVDACEKTFQRYLRSGLLTQKIVWHRVVLAMKKRNMKLAKHLMKKLESEQDRIWLQRWINMDSKPEIMLAKPELLADRDVVRQIVLHGINRIGRYDLEKARMKWQSAKKTYQFEFDVVTKWEQKLALKAAYAGHPKALEWLAELENFDNNAAQWRIRLALRAGLWAKALDWIILLPAHVRDKEKWRYWYGRSLQELGKQNADYDLNKQALTLFTALSKNRSYYGFMAADRIGGKYELNLPPAKFSDHDLKRIAQIPGMIRARELYLLAMYESARSEWRHTIGKLPRTDLKLAAGLASQWGWYDRAIYTFAQMQAPRFAQTDLPYPIAFRDTVLKNAKRHKIDPAWVYGVLRQESAFMPDARSSAGAMGLMQIMPKTARYLSKKTKTRMKRMRELFKPEKNIYLGSAYLGMLLKRHNGNAVLATASYNAGGSRTKRWLPEKSISADVWVESIPFTETRNYVGKVLGYTVIFDHLLHGKASRLEKRMPNVVPLAKK